MRRRLARPFGQKMPPARMLSLLMGLALLALMYQRFKEPQFWRWMTNESRADSADISENANQKDSLPTPHSPLPTSETIVPGPNETDPDELAKLRSNLKAIQDRKELLPHDMPAYWQLMKWSRSRQFVELEKLARRDVPYSHLWEEPDLYRGQPIRLKLHVRRILHYDAVENPLGLKKVYEAWGWTDDSRSFPFVVVFPEKPAGLPIGTDVDGDIVFVGYFVKWMGYRAFDTKKNAPLLVGRTKPAIRAAGTAQGGGWEMAFLTLVGGIIALTFVGWFSLGALRRSRSTTRTNGTLLEQLPENWLASTPATTSSEWFTESTPKPAEPVPIRVEPSAAVAATNERTESMSIPTEPPQTAN